MIGIEVTGGLKKDRELADEIVWWCMDMLLPRHHVMHIDVKFTKTFEDDAQGFCYRGDDCLLYTSPSPRDLSTSRMPSSA